MNKWLELLVGLVLVILPIIAAIQNWGNLQWGAATLQFLMGGIIVVVVLIGLLFIMLGISDIKG